MNSIMESRLRNRSLSNLQLSRLTGRWRKMSRPNISFQMNGAALIGAVFTAMVGHHIHGSVFWSIVDFIFWPIALIKWLIYHEISLSVIKATFAFFFN